MWQPVAWIDDRLLRRAYSVVSESRPEGQTYDEFRARLTRLRVHLYYYRGADFEVVLGFYPRAAESEWRVTSVAYRGVLTTAVFELGIDKAIEFSQSHNFRPLSVVIRRRPPTDPISAAYDIALAYLRGHAGVKEVREFDEGDRRLLLAVMEQPIDVAMQER